MIRIERLSIRLPAALAHRAEGIAQALGAALAGPHDLPAGDRAHIALAPMRADPGVDDATLGSRLGAALRDALAAPEA